MPFQIVRNDMIRMEADAIVNTANPDPVVGSGLDAHIHQAAGPELLEARRKIGRIPVGHAAITPAFALKARYVIHAVGPVWRGGFLGERAQLARCFRSALSLALEYGCESVALPLISTGNYRFPKDQALDIALGVIRDFLSEQEMQITLVVFDRESFHLSEQLSRAVTSYIDEHCVRRTLSREYAPDPNSIRRDFRSDEETDAFSEFSSAAPPFGFFEAPRAELKSAPRTPPKRSQPPKSVSLDQLLKKLDAGFTETLLSLIDKTGKKDSVIYKKANISKQHFSKIRNNPDYKPTKATAVAFAIALELDLAQTRDLIGRAGYALTGSSVFDVIIMFFIERKIYDLYQINLALFEHDQPLLGQ